VKFKFIGCVQSLEMSLDFVFLCPLHVEIIQQQDIRLSLKDSRQFGAEHYTRMLNKTVRGDATHHGELTCHIPVCTEG
jgi:hypothetical protein